MNRAIVAAGFLLCAAAVPAIAWANAFNIHAGEAPRTIPIYAAQADVQVLAAEKVLQGQRTNSVRGEMAPTAALNQLIAGSDLQATPRGPRTVVISRTRRAAVARVAAAIPARARSAGSAPMSRLAAQQETGAAIGEGEIIVTARRREERLQDVPVAVTAISGEQIERANLASLQDIRRVAPSLNISQSAGGGRNTPLFTIRGQRQGDTLASVDPSVGVYIGDQLFKRTYGLDQIIFDMQTIEVLKGPQGTLFGLNTTGGNIVFRPALPNDTFSAAVKVGLGNFDYRAAEGYINVPLGPIAALRIAGQYKKRDGYIRSAITGQRAQDLDGGAVRATLKLGDGGPLDSLFTGSFAKSSTNGTGWRLQLFQQFSGVNGTGVPAGLTDVNCGGANVASCTLNPLYGATGYTAAELSTELAQVKALGFYENRQERLGRVSTDPAWNIANTTSYRISDDITLKNIIGYREYKTSMLDDFDGSNLQILEYGNQQHGKELSEEFQILGETGGISWIAGAYYFHEHVESRNQNLGQISAKLLGIRTPSLFIESVRNTSTSLFGSATQKLDAVLPGLSATVGGRYTWDKKDAKFGTIDRVGYAPGDLTGLGTLSTGQGCRFDRAADPNILLPQYRFDPATCLVDLDKKFEAFTYTLSLDWKIDRDKLIYVAHRKGYRGGGFGTRGANSLQLAPYNPEVVRDIELGGKFDFHFGDGMLFRINAAVYKQWYKDIQRTVSFLIPPNIISTNIVNAADATIQGFEVETTFKPVPWLDLGAYVSHVDPRYRHFFVASSKTGVGLVDIADTTPFSGVARWQFGISGSVNLPVSEDVGTAAISLNYYHQSSYWMQDATDYIAGGRTPGYGLLNGRVELSNIGRSGFTAALFANNILEKKYYGGNYSLASSFGFASSIAGAPRMYGLELGYRF